MVKLCWRKLLNSERFSKSLRPPPDGLPSSPDWLISDRTQIERDFDRILFSAPMRRLGDKTQVFPRERNESVRNRLTHTHEVTNLARTVAHFIVNGELGKKITAELGDEEEPEKRMRRDVTAMLTAISLAHDLGNPPFGHEGEEAIRAWIQRHEDSLFSDVQDLSAGDESPVIEPGLSKAQRADFLLFEGNAQTLRVVARLQVVDDDLGLNLTFGTLAALMKYTASSDAVQKQGANAALKKVGYFQSEQNLVKTARDACGLPPGVRHPLTFIMEACDDVAYTVLDAEDAVKKQIVSFPDVLYWMRGDGDVDELTEYVVKHSEFDYDHHRKATSLSPAELNDVSMQKFRVHAIHAMMSAVIRAFLSKYDPIMNGEFQSSLIDVSRAASFARKLKEFDARHAYRDRRVRGLELEGFNVLNGLMDSFWTGITERPNFKELSPKRRLTPFASYAYDRISENYRRVFENTSINRYRKDDPQLPIRYRELQLLTDMVSGMTDEYAIDLHNELQAYKDGGPGSNRFR
jgi:dGTPase